MTSTHLLSLHPIHAQNMLDGLKTIEWRRRWPNVVHAGDRLILYATAPVSALIGEVTVHAVHRGTPDELWALHQPAGMVGEDLFRQYMGTVSSAVAVEVAHPQRWAQPLALDDLKTLNRYDFHPPQTTARIDPVAVERYRQWARWNAIGQGRCAWNESRPANPMVTAEDFEWIRTTLLDRSSDPVATQAWWSDLMAIVQEPLAVRLRRDNDTPAHDEHNVMVLHVNQAGPLDPHGRPVRRRAGFLVTRTPGFPTRYDQAGQPMGPCGLDAWFVEPWAEDLGWTQHLMAVSMHVLETVTPTLRVRADDLARFAPMARAMRWGWSPGSHGDVIVNDRTVPAARLRDPQDLVLPPATSPRRTPGR